MHSIRRKKMKLRGSEPYKGEKEVRKKANLIKVRTKQKNIKRRNYETK